MRQYRLAASTSFRCFRCGLAKTSKLVTVFRQDWNNLLCNGCYGRLLSLHDIRAGSADDSERADALAEQLLVLVSVDEQRDAMELLRALEQVTAQHRNRAVHTDELEKSDFDACHQLVLGEQGMLWAIVRATKSRRQ